MAKNRNFGSKLELQRKHPNKEIEQPEFNGWSIFPEIRKTGKIIRLEFQDGCEDFWGQKVFFGIREIRIYGRIVDLSKKQNLLRSIFPTKKNYRHRGRFCRLL